MPPSQGANSNVQDRASQAQMQCQMALKHYQNRNISGAIKALGTALDLDSSLRSDDRILRFASRVVGLSPDEAILALTDLKTREALILKEGKRTPAKSAPLQAQPLWILGSAVLFMTIIGIVALILSGQLKFNPLNPLASQADVQIHQLASEPDQTYIVASPFGTPSLNGWPVLVAVHGKDQTGQDMLNLLGDVTRTNGILLIVPTFTAIHDGTAKDSFYKKASFTLINIIEEVKSDGMANPQHNTHYLGQVFMGYAEGAPLVTYIAQQGIDYADAGFSMQGPLGVALVNPRAPLYDAATYYPPPVYLLLYGELAPHAAVSKDYHRRLKNQGAAVYMESAAGADASMTTDQMNIVASFVLEAYNPSPSFVVTATP